VYARGATLKRTTRRLILPAALLVGLGVAFTLLSLRQPYSGFGPSAIVDIPRGASTSQMASILAAAGVVRYRWQFLLSRAIHSRTTLQAGEYLFNHPASVLEVFDRIARGDVAYYEVTIPEGSNMFDIAARVAELGWMGEKEFLAAAADPLLIRDLAPEAPSLEGYLFPSTYHVQRSATAQQLCRQMTGAFRAVWRELSASADVHETVTLASLVEKETGVAHERPLVASVFHNRLRQGLALACDPTIIYAALLEGRYRGAIYKSDLSSRNRYNTYRHPGLPPGPIANPGRASLAAALRPAETKYLYFVAKPGGSGEHTFSSSFAAHERAVAEYRRGNQKAASEGTTGPPPAGSGR
jgi:UPF0755 protein